MDSREVIRVERRMCPHCDKSVSLKTYNTHKRRYFDEKTNLWIKESAVSSPSDLESAVISPASDLESPPHVIYECSTSSTTQNVSYSSELEYVGECEEMDGGNADTDSSSEDEDVEEIWEGINEENVLNDFLISDEEPPSLIIQEQECGTPSKPLCDWLVAFLIHLQIVYSIPDVAMEAVLKFLSMFFLILGTFAPTISTIGKRFPCSMYRLKAYMEISQSVALQKYVVCRKCHQIYNFKDCVNGSGLSVKSGYCTYCEFPQHSQRRMREKCGVILLKTVELCSGRKFLYPFMTYCYLGLECSLESHLLNPSFSTLTEHWRSTYISPSSSTSKLCDVYDGKIWSDFQRHGDQPYLLDMYNFGLMMNIDWFRPYKHVLNYSVGAIYLVFMNLPRHLRFKRENVLLIGILPGPSEPPHDINSYIRPLVSEFIQFWSGVNMAVHGQDSNKLIRCALLCVSCDIPAGRKVCGFPGHAAKRGCSRCNKLFGGSFGNIDYSGFDRTNWPSRTVSDHKQAIQHLRKCSTKSQLVKIESATGYHDSVLLDLPYFNSVRMLVIDPMHNLFLGTAKTVLKRIWIDECIVSSDNFVFIQKRIDKCKTPSDIGRIPYKILSGFSSLTADQLKNWVVYNSLLVLRDILVDDHLECWRHFVLACRILIQYQISKEKVSLADAFLLQFCKRVERLYGGSVITPNMHFQCHLKDCVLDYGPFHGFWCFSFERYNGLLGGLPTNNRSIEVQVINRFTRDNVLLSRDLPEEFADDFKQLIPNQKFVGSVLDGVTKCSLPVSSRINTMFGSNIITTNFEVTFPGVCTRHLFSASEITDMNLLYSKIYSATIDVPASHKRYSTLRLDKKQIGSHRSRSANSSLLMAVWIPYLFGLSESLTDYEERPVQINYFAQHTINVDGVIHSSTVACVSWFKEHPRKHFYGKPITVWQCDLFETSCCSIIPINFIIRRTVSLVDIDSDGSLALFVCPCVEF